MPERFKVVCIPCKALYKCSDLPFLPLVDFHSSIRSSILHADTLFALIRTNCLPVLLYGTEVSPTNSAIIQSLQFTINKVFFKLFGFLSKECYTEIGYYFGIGSIEEIVRKRPDKFNNGYDVSDNCLCQLLHHKC